MVEKSAFEEQAKELLGGYATVDPSLVGCIAAALTEARKGAIEEMIKACEDERVDFEATQHDSDRAYNQAIDDCVERCRALRGNG